MKTSTKVILTATFIGTLGLSGLARTVLAQPQSPVAVMPQHHSSNLIAQTSDRNEKVSDGDGETPPALESMTIPSTTSRQKTPMASPMIDSNPPTEVPSPSLYNYGV